MTTERIARLRNGIDICWDERGEGPTMLLVMGIGAQMVLWPEGLCDALAERGFRVVRFDNRDVGRSSKLERAGVPRIGPTLASMLLGLPIQAPYALEDMAGDAAGLLDAMEVDQAHVVGVSMGGMIAQTMAITHPHRMRSLVSIMSTTGQRGVLISQPSALRALFQPPPKTREQAVQRTKTFFRVVGSHGYDRDEAELERQSLRAWDRGPYPRGVLRHLAAIAATGDRTSRLRFVQVPTLVLHGTEDPLIRPVGGELTAAAIPNAKLRFIEGMGHDLPRGAWPLMVDLITRHAREADGAR
jgi:pimeloyl-ACP methyl ester carboxylesterase